MQRRRFSASKRERVYNESHGKCSYCGKRLQRGPDWHIEHIKPYSHYSLIVRLTGWPDRYANLTAACVTCNLKKGAKTPKQAGMKLKYGEYSLLSRVWRWLMIRGAMATGLILIIQILVNWR